MPTKKDGRANDSKTFKNDDLLNNESFADNLIYHVNSQYKVLDESLVISLNGIFGCGKTWFLKMLKAKLEEDKYNVIYIDCWKEDLFSEPLITIISGIYNYINTHTFQSNNAEKIKNCLKYIVAFASSATNQVMENQTGINFKKTIDDLKSQNPDAEIEILSNSIFEQHNSKMELLNLFNETLHEFILKLDKKPLYILVDELDRARPDYAVNFLETLKHFFYKQGIVFIMAVNRDQLKSSVMCLYGNTLNFDEYYRKFVHRNVFFPKLSNDKMKKYVEQKVEKHFTASDNLYFITEFKADKKSDIAQLCLSFDLMPRQINELFRIISYFLLKEKDDNRLILDNDFYAILIYTIVSLDNSELLNSIICSNNIYEELIALFKSKEILKNNENKSHWGQLLLFISTNLDNFDHDFNEYMKLDIPVRGVESEQDQKRYLKSSIFPNIYLNPAYQAEKSKISAINKIAHRIDNLLHFYDKQ